jgi:hypothetical protein
MRIVAALALAAWCVALAGPRWQRSAAGLPADADAFMKKVRAATRLDREVQKDFSYLERGREVRLSKLGKVMIGQVRTFEVSPSPITGRPSKRLIALDDKPLDPAELARLDAERDESLREEEARRRTETGRQRAARLESEAEDRREREAKIDDAIAVFHVTFTHRDVIDGRPVLIGKATPRQDARVTTREGRWMKQFAGDVWVSEADHQIARLEMRALDEVSIGWGIVGRVHQGSRILFARRKVDDSWLPAEITFEGSGRTLLFRRFQIQATTTFSNYRRLVQ